MADDSPAATPAEPSKYTIEPPKAAAGDSGKYTIEPPASTTASGVAASAARGLAPYAAGAAAGAAMGAPFAGVGAVPGAVAGIGAVGLTELGTGLYNAIAPRVSRLPQVLTPQGATDRLLDAFGIKRPSTPAEHMVETAAGMAPFGATPLKGAADLGALVLENRAGAAEKYIDSLYSRAIKPSTVGRDTTLQRRSAISDIVQNKPELHYTNELGEVASSAHLPETVAQFGQAIDHSKSKLFNEWDELARASGDAGGRVDVSGVVRELRAKAADPVLQRQMPNAAKYAEDLAGRYEATGALMPSEAQREIASWNRQLDAFYKNPSSEGTGIAGVNETVARVLRQGLDEAVEATVTPGYQSLKTRYGSLSAIEKDVDRATRRISNREPGGGLLGRGANLLATEEIARGAITGNMKAVGTGAAVKAWAEYMKWRNAPNRAIKELFKTAEKYHKPPPEGAAPPGLPPIIPSGSQPVRPAGEVAMSPQKPGVPAPAGGQTMPEPTIPVIPNRQLPRSDFERAMGGGLFY